MAVLGGNTGEPNIFTGVNVADLTGGVLNAETPLQGNNAICLAFRAVSAAAPGISRALIKSVLLTVRKLTIVLTPVIEEMGCPELVKFDTTAFGKFPEVKCEI